MERTDRTQRRGANIVNVRPAGDDHQVVTVHSQKGDSWPYRKEPCAQCPWRKDATGVFPAEAFRHSAYTAYDMNVHTFACHDSGAQKPAVCAGFLLRGADHNMAVRLAAMSGKYRYDMDDGGHELHESYRAMAVANGVSPDDPVLMECRD